MDEPGITINGVKYRELRCKNDPCRKLFIYEKILVGRFAWICDRCGMLNEFNFTMLKTSENMNTIKDNLMKGGEK